MFNTNSELSDFYNNKPVERSKRNQITASLFYDVAPFDPKTINRNVHKSYEHNGCKDQLERIIENTQHQLAKIIRKHNLNYTVIAVTVQRKLYREPKTAELEKENKDAFYALFQIRLWQAILEGREIIEV